VWWCARKLASCECSWLTCSSSATSSLMVFRARSLMKQNSLPAASTSDRPCTGMHTGTHTGTHTGRRQARIVIASQHTAAPAHGIMRTTHHTTACRAHQQAHKPSQAAALLQQPPAQQQDCRHCSPPPPKQHSTAACSMRQPLTSRPRGWSHDGSSSSSRVATASVLKRTHRRSSGATGCRG
jgi:hypothetical protein